jgi:hypothetical protein
MCGGQTGTGTGFPISVSFQQLPTLILFYVLLVPARQTDEASQAKRSDVSEIGERVIERDFYLSLRS